MFEEKHIHFQGGKISFYTKGKGRALVFLHGFLQSKHIWKEFLSDFPKSYRLICIDLPAHGNSSTYGYYNSMENMADAVKAVLDSINLKRYVLIGHSMGGYVALAFGEKYTDHLIAMVLMNSTAKADTAERRRSRKQMSALVKVDKEKVIKQLIPGLFHTTRWRRYRTKIKELIYTAKQMSHQSIISSIEGMVKRKEREIIVKFAPYPILYIIGEKDPIFDSETLVSESKLSEKSSFYIIEDVGHMAMVEAKKICRNCILKFLKKV